MFSRRAWPEINPRGGNAARKSVRGPRGVHANGASQRAGPVRQAAPATPSAAIHRPQVSRAPVLLQADRRRAHRHVPDGHAREHRRDFVRKCAALLIFCLCIQSVIYEDMILRSNAGLCRF